jgi:hypothetical protein
VRVRATRAAQWGFFGELVERSSPALPVLA